MTPLAKPKLTLPFDLPAFVLNRSSVGLFNALYYNKQLGKQRPGFPTTSRSSTPWTASCIGIGCMARRACCSSSVFCRGQRYEGIVQRLKAITASGLASFLAVIKVFGDIRSPGMMSFPMPGITLALDFPIRREMSFGLLDRLADITAEFGGRMYPAKDACMSAAHFQQFYPQWQELSAYSIRHSAPASGSG